MAGGRSSATVCGVGAITAYGWGRKPVGRPGKRPVRRRRIEGLGRQPRPRRRLHGQDRRYPSRGPAHRFSRAMESAVDEAIEDAYERGW